MGINTSNPLANLDVNGTIKLGANGTVFTNLIKGSFTLEVPSIAVNSSLIQTFTVANATAGGVVSISPDVALPVGVLMCNARVSAANTVEVTFRNTSLSIQLNPVSMAYHIAIILLNTLNQTIMKNLFLLLICWTMSNQGFCQRVGLNKLFFPLEVVSQNDTPNPVLIRADVNNTGLATIALNANNLTATTNYTLGRNGSNSAILSYDQTINNLTFRVSNQPFMALRVNAANNFVAVNYFNASPNLAQLEVYGTTKCGADGTVMNSIIKRTITMDIPTISAGQTATLTFILSAVAPLGSVVSISPEANLDPKLVIDYARVSASGVVDVVITNISTTFAQRNAILPTQGLTIFDITNSSYWYFDGESWVNLAIASANP